MIKMKNINQKKYNIWLNNCAVINASLKFATVFLAFNILTMSSLSHAQEEVAAEDEKKTALERFMDSNEPAQSALGDSNQPATPEPQNAEAAPKPTLLDRLSEAAGTNTQQKEPEPVVEEVQEPDDALPELEPTRLKMRTYGFDGASGKNVYVELDNNNPEGMSEQELEEEIRREAFDAAITGLFPMKTDQIKSRLLEYDATKRVVKEPIRGVPTPKISVETVSLDPGTVPMIITTAPGHVTTLNILDATGAPWPIANISWAGDFEVNEPEAGGHTLRITPLEQAAYGNISIQLLTLKTPVTMMLKTSKTEVQYRVDARIPEYGPFASAPLIEGGTERVAGNQLIISVLDGVPPSGAVKMDVTGVDGRTSAYNYNGMTYVRTPLTLLSPGWDQSVSSADGMNVYALNETPVLLLSDGGRFMRAGLNTAKDLFDE